jgi:hypothetical protein
VSPVVVVLPESGRGGERGRDIERGEVGRVAQWESEVPDVEAVVIVVELGRSGLALEAESEGRVGPLEREGERDKEREKKP